jgi:hypothetical protein
MTRKDGWLMRLEISVYERLEWDQERQGLHTGGETVKGQAAQHHDPEERLVDGVAV